MWISTIVVLLGAEINSEIEHRALPTTAGAESRLGHEELGSQTPSVLQNRESRLNADPMHD
jgi:uncharacterized BrkB/YihY/UPF0761 family membrane protein